MTTEASTEMVSTVLRVWAPGIFFFSTFYVLLRGFYALGDTKTPMLINIAGFAVNVGFNLAVVALVDDPRMQIAGLAAGHAASCVVASGLALRAISGKIGARPTNGYYSALAKMVVASAITGAGAWLAAQGVGSVVDGSSVAGLLLQVLAVTTTGLLLYAGLSKALSLEEMRWISTIVKQRRRTHPRAPPPRSSWPGATC